MELNQKSFARKILQKKIIFFAKVGKISEKILQGKFSQQIFPEKLYRKFLQPRFFIKIPCPKSPGKIFRPRIFPRPKYFLNARAPPKFPARKNPAKTTPGSPPL